MTLNKRIVTISMILLGMAAVCPTGRADNDGLKILVGQPNTGCPNAQYSTIAAAISAAPTGAEIDICPALYAEQLIINKPLTLRGVPNQNGVDRVLLRPALTSLGGLPFEAVITVINTSGVTIENLAIDGSQNTVSGCATYSNGAVSGSLAGIHFLNSSGSVKNNAIFGTQLAPPGCAVPGGAVQGPALFPGNGFGIELDTDGKSQGPFQVSVEANSIHDFGRNGILVVGSAVKAEITDNAISGVGPSTGANQFGIFLAYGTMANVSRNLISQGLCGSLSLSACFNLRSEGIVMRAVADGTILDGNIITNVQSGLFLNGANAARITNNIIQNVQGLDGIDVQGTAAGHFTNSLFEGNRISNVFPIDSYATSHEASCGINEAIQSGVAGNIFRNNYINDAFCGIAAVTADSVQSNEYANTLYGVLNADQYPDTFPPAAEP